MATLDRRRVREGFERRFTVERMADDYLAIYRRLQGIGLAAMRARVDNVAAPSAGRGLGAPSHRPVGVGIEFKNVPAAIGTGPNKGPKRTSNGWAVIPTE